MRTAVPEGGEEPCSKGQSSCGFRARMAVPEGEEAPYSSLVVTGSAGGTRGLRRKRALAVAGCAIVLLCAVALAALLVNFFWLPFLALEALLAVVGRISFPSLDPPLFLFLFDRTAPLQSMFALLHPHLRLTTWPSNDIFSKGLLPLGHRRESSWRRSKRHLGQEVRSREQ